MNGHFALAEMPWRRSVFEKLARLLVLLMPSAASGQAVGIGAHYGAGMSPSTTDGIVMIGAQGELFIRPELVVVARGDVYVFGFSCIGFGECPNEVSTLSVGAQYRSAGGVASFYLGGDIGRTWSAADVQGWVARPRTGVDIRITSWFYGNGELAYARFVHDVGPGSREPPSEVIGLSAGLRVRF